MFAFAIWDNWEKNGLPRPRSSRNQTPLLLAIRHYPGFCFRTTHRLGLRSSVQKNSALQDSNGYLTTGSVPEPHTLIDQIYLLQAGYSLQWQAGETQQHRYWNIDFHSKIIDLEDAITLTRSALLDSVKHHLISDVPVGIFLSGGIDSTAMVALARQTQN